jgi:hypothetical protein
MFHKSLSLQGQLLSRFDAKAWLPFKMAQGAVNGHVTPLLKFLKFEILQGIESVGWQRFYVEFEIQKFQIHFYQTLDFY